MKFLSQIVKKNWKRTICFSYVGRGIFFEKEAYLPQYPKILLEKPSSLLVNNKNVLTSVWKDVRKYGR